MPLSAPLTLPVAAINIGLAASVPGLAVPIAKFTADISDLAPATSGQLQITGSFPPDPITYASGIANGLKLSAVAAALGGLAFTGGPVNGSIVAKVGFLQGQISTLGTVTAPLEAGLATGGLSGWNYAGRAPGFGEQLERQTLNGYPGANPDDVIAGVVIATESFSSWGSFSKGFNAGASATLPVEQGEARLVFMGTLGAAEWNTSVAALLARFNIFLGKLKGQKGGLEAAAQVSLGLNLPSADALVSAGANVVAELGVDGLLDNLVNVQADLQGVIGSIQAKIDAVVELQGDLSAQLSAGGLSVWTYSGRAGDFGRALRAELVNGLPNASGPNATAYGLAIAGSPPAMSIFGGIFIT